MMMLGTSKGDRQVIIQENFFTQKADGKRNKIPKFMAEASSCTFLFVEKQTEWEWFTGLVMGSRDPQGVTMCWQPTACKITQGSPSSSPLQLTLIVRHMRWDLRRDWRETASCSHRWIMEEVRCGKGRKINTHAKCSTFVTSHRSESTERFHS